MISQKSSGGQQFHLGGIGLGVTQHLDKLSLLLPIYKDSENFAVTQCDGEVSVLELYKPK